MQFTHNTLPETIRAQSVALLNRHLAAAIDLYGQMKHAHWNVRGPGFLSIHELFDKVAGVVDGYADDLAERVGALGGTAEGTVQVASQRSFLVPNVLGIGDEKQYAFAGAGALAAFGQSVREASASASALGDADTSDLFTEISRDIDQQLWFVESHVAPQDLQERSARSSPRR